MYFCMVLIIYLLYYDIRLQNYLYYHSNTSQINLLEYFANVINILGIKITNKYKRLT